MATLVLSTVGTVLGGPIGSAIGALIGQSIDQQILAPASRGPRLGDLNVQSSSYGTQVPRIYGTMRVAGSVIWSTDLAESAQTTGAKGQPDVVYSYSVSFAVALSSRQVMSIRRIWADGKLIRGEDEQFKISTTFRFYDGSEDQIIDPLIGSIEGIGNTPGYRGLALVVFENLELAEFGNRIPFLTFEVIADEAPPTISEILSDASRQAIVCDASRTVGGYAAYGRSIKAAAEPLVDCFAVELFDDGLAVRGTSSDITAVGEDELGSSADDGKVPRIEREQLPACGVPAVLRLSYYDPSRDYQTGEARATASEQRGNEQQRELPAAVDAAGAKTIAQQSLARTWVERDKLTLKLPPRYLGLEPGSRIELALSPKRWIVTKSTIDGFAVVAELTPSWSAGVTAAGSSPMMFSPATAADEISIALFDVPDVFGQSMNDPVLLLAASSPASGWRRRAVDVSFAGQTIATATARRKSILGYALSTLALAEPYLIDTQCEVDVQLVDPDQWLAGCDDDALSEGANLAILGSELIQFADVVPLGDGRFRLRRLLRGRGGTEWAASIHKENDAFVLIESGSLQTILLPRWIRGSKVHASVSGDAAAAEVLLTAESLRPPSPIGLKWTLHGNGDVELSWTRRSRSGWAWLDEVDIPIGEDREEYRVTLIGSLGSIDISVAGPQLTIATDQLSAVGAGSATVRVRQIGDWAASQAAELNLIIS
jgi:hypothetical protein